MSSTSLSKTQKTGNKVEGWGVRKVAASVAPNLACSNVRRIQSLPIKSQTLASRELVSFLSGAGRNALQSQEYIHARGQLCVILEIAQLNRFYDANIALL